MNHNSESGCPPAPVRPLDLLIRNGLIYDGTGAPGFRGDLGVREGKVIQVGSISADTRAAKTVDATGLVVAPGFIDVHTHADIALQAHPDHLPKVMQGVTTEVFTNCGLGFAPVTDEGLAIQKHYLSGLFGPDENVDWGWRTTAELLQRYEDRGTGTNVAYLVPHGALRASVMGMAAREASAAELDWMSAMLQGALGDGAWGLSTGLWYAPMKSASRAENVRLCGEAGFFATHQRDYETNLFPATRETLEIAREAHVPVQLAHLQFNGAVNRHRASELLELLDQFRDEEGVDVTWDSYPYLAGSTLIQAILPEWATAGGPEALLKRLRYPEERERIAGVLADSGRGWDRTMLSGAHSSQNLKYEGESFERIAADRGISAAELVCRLIEEEQLKACFVYHNAHEDDLRAALRHPCQMIGSDGLHLQGKCHPRLYGTFPRVLGHYAREQQVISLEEAVRKMTSAPARRLGLPGRGVLTPGAAADLVLFDREIVCDTATYSEPRSFPNGIPFVFVNGTAVKWNGEPTRARPGKVLRKS